jgi:hypothetical protein
MRNFILLMSSLCLLILSLSACDDHKTHDESAPQVSNHSDKNSQEEKSSNAEQIVSAETISSTAVNKIGSVQQIKELKAVKETQKLVNTMSYQGTIQFLNLEGGFYGIVTKKGKKLLPMNLDKAYKTPGAIVEISGHAVNVMTIQQWGTPFQIETITLISPAPIDQSQM